jgi:hypothetical protein
VIDGFRYVAKRSDLKTILFMVFWIGTFGLNFPIFISTMSVTVFHAGAHQFGLLTSLMAMGSVAGALLATGRTNPRITLLAVSALCFGLGCALGAVMPTYWLFGQLETFAPAMDLTDGCLVNLQRRIPASIVVTTDHCDFATYRCHSCLRWDYSLINGS